MLEVFIILFLIFMNGVFCIAEVALISVRKNKLQSEIDETGDKKAKTALVLAKDPDKFLSSVQTGITAVSILTGIFSGNKIAEAFSSLLVSWGLAAGLSSFIAKTIIVIIVMFLTILFGELVPKRIAMANPEKWAKKVSRFLVVFDWIAAPFISLLSKCTGAISRKLGVSDVDDKVTEDDIVSMVQEGTNEGEVSPVEQDIVERVFQLGDLSISNIMTLRDDIVCLDINMGKKEINDIILANIFEQYPVVDGDLDHVEGVLTLKDYFLSISAGGEFDLRKIIKTPFYVHENMSVYATMEFLRDKKASRALVCDEFGSLTGIISLRDILDALVGDIGATHQKEPDIVPRKNGDGWLVDGQCSIYDFMSYFDKDDDMEDFDFSTVGGLVLEELEHVPTAGERIEWKDFSFEVVDMDGARIDKLIVKRLPEDRKDAPAKESSEKQ